LKFQAGRAESLAKLNDEQVKGRKEQSLQITELQNQLERVMEQAAGRIEIPLSVPKLLGSPISPVKQGDKLVSMKTNENQPSNQQH